MSTNFHINAKREIFIPKINKYEEQYIWFDCIQTPSVDTQVLMSSKDPIKAYKKWVKINFPKVYKFHIKELRDFILVSNTAGFEVGYEAW